MTTAEPDPIRFSNLKLMARSPAHYAHNLSVPFEQTAAMRVGSAIDAMFFQTQRVVCYPKPRDIRHKAYQEFLEANADAIVLAPAEMAQASDATEALMAHADACQLLFGQVQQRIEWTINGRACSGTPDVFTSLNAHRVVDLKKTRCGDPEKFKWDARRLCYHGQLAWYRNGLLEAGKLSGDPGCFIVTVETERPCLVTCFELTRKTVELGDRTWRLWFERLMACEQSESFPGYAQSVVPLDLDDFGEPVSLVLDGEEIEV
jgi:hypothetical protein